MKAVTQVAAFVFYGALNLGGFGSITNKILYC